MNAEAGPSWLGRVTAMEYKGYVARIEYDDSVNSLHGYVANSGAYSIANFYGNDVAELEREFAASIDEYLASCDEDGVEPAGPFSGGRRPTSHRP